MYNEFSITTNNDRIITRSTGKCCMAIINCKNAYILLTGLKELKIGTYKLSINTIDIRFKYYEKFVTENGDNPIYVNLTGLKITQNDHNKSVNDIFLLGEDIVSTKTKSTTKTDVIYEKVLDFVLITDMDTAKYIINLTHVCVVDNIRSYVP